MRKSFTIIELLVMIAIIAILAAILFPVFAQAKLFAKKTDTITSIKHLPLGLQIYAADTDDGAPMCFNLVDPGDVSLKSTRSETRDVWWQPFLPNFPVGVSQHNLDVKPPRRRFARLRWPVVRRYIRIAIKQDAFGPRKMLIPGMDNPAMSWSLSKKERGVGQAPFWVQSGPRLSMPAFQDTYDTPYVIASDRRTRTTSKQPDRTVIKIDQFTHKHSWKLRSKVQNLLRSFRQRESHTVAFA